MNFSKITTITILFFFLQVCFSQGIDSLIVETYHEPSESEIEQYGLPEGLKVYRLYVDLAPGYKFQAMYGEPDHEMYIKTSTFFHNDTKLGAETGDRIYTAFLSAGTVLYDSWLTVGAATSTHIGIMKEEDNDTSIISVEGLDKADGLLRYRRANIYDFNLDLDFFNSQHENNIFSTTDGALAVKNGIKGPTDHNRILIAQLATNGKLSFQLNLQVISPDGVVEKYVANNAKGSEIYSKYLTYNN